MIKNRITFEEFKEEVRSNILQFMSDEFSGSEVSIQQFRKNNNHMLFGLSVRKPKTVITPVIYLEPYFAKYEEGMELDDVMRHIANASEARQTDGFDNVPERFIDYEGFVKSHLTIAVVNAERNKNLLKDVPHTMVEDLAIIYKVVVGEKNDDVSTITVRKEHMRFWKIDDSTLHTDAVENSQKMFPAVVKSMGEYISGVWINLEPKTDQPDPFYIITNKKMLNGASAIFYSDVLENLSKELNTDLYLLPSSIHEMIIIPASCGNPEALSEMVKDVNSTMVSVEEQLSDHAYTYSNGIFKSVA